LPWLDPASQTTIEWGRAARQVLLLMGFDNLAALQKAKTGGTAWATASNKLRPHLQDPDAAVFTWRTETVVEEQAQPPPAPAWAKPTTAARTHTPIVTDLTPEEIQAVLAARTATPKRAGPPLDRLQGKSPATRMRLLDLLHEPGVDGRDTNAWANGYIDLIDAPDRWERAVNEFYRITHRRILSGKEYELKLSERDLRDMLARGPGKDPNCKPMSLLSHRISAAHDATDKALKTFHTKDVLDMFALYCAAVLDVMVLDTEAGGFSNSVTVIILARDTFQKQGNTWPTNRGPGLEVAAERIRDMVMLFLKEKAGTQHEHTHAMAMMEGMKKALDDGKLHAMTPLASEKAAAVTATTSAAPAAAAGPAKETAEAKAAKAAAARLAAAGAADARAAAARPAINHGADARGVPYSRYNPNKDSACKHGANCRTHIAHLAAPAAAPKCWVGTH
jgi:hypothetical protein